MLSRIDYASTLLYGLPFETTKRLHGIFKTSVRLIYCRRRRESTAPLLAKLRWLPLDRRIQLKMAVFAFRCRRGLAPSYLSSLIRHYVPGRSLRSERDPTRLEIPRTKNDHGRRSFPCAAPTVWSSIPQRVRELDALVPFKSGVKKFLLGEKF